jgi:hypothetical protein
VEQATPPNNAVDDTTKSQLIAVAWQLRHRFPPESLLLPTSLGNVLRAAEYRAGRAYGLDSVVIWPRLYPLLPETVRNSVDDVRLQLDVAARFTAVFLLGTVFSAALLITHTWWLLLPAFTLLLAWISYRASVNAAAAYGVGVETAFDLGHLRAALHLRQPPDRASERANNRQLTDFFRGVPTDLQYEQRT